MRNRRVISFVRELFQIYMKKHISRSAAELSYFLTLSVFPTLICLYSIFGGMIPTHDIIERVFKGVIPTETLDAISGYLDYVRLNSGKSMLAGGAVLMASSSAAAFRSLHNIMAEIQGVPKYRGVGFFAVSFVFSLVFLVVMYFAAVVIVTGEWFLGILSEFVPVPWDWSWLRFVLLFAVLLLLILGVYRLTSPSGSRGLLPGAVLSAAAMVIVGMVFSAMVSLSVRYSLVYGSMASMIVLMLWLYFFGNILITGNAANFLLRKYWK
ncbi:MAG: YihY/virulence factor BrkB family protein [Candidatus Heteroscillospira sp.]|jgi:membrane protein